MIFKVGRNRMRRWSLWWGGGGLQGGEDVKVFFMGRRSRYFRRRWRRWVFSVGDLGHLSF